MEENDPSFGFEPENSDKAPEQFGPAEPKPQPQSNPYNARQAGVSIAKDATAAATAAASGNMVGAALKGARATLTALRDPNLRETLRSSRNPALSFAATLTSSLQGRLAIAGVVCIIILLVCMPLFFIAGGGSGTTEGGITGDGGNGRTRLTNVVPGNYLEMMTPVYTRQVGPSKGKQFTMSSGQGIFSYECNARVSNGGPRCVNTSLAGNCLFYCYDTYYSEALGKRVPFTDKDAQFYVTGRWPGTQANWCGAQKPLTQAQKLAQGNLNGAMNDYFGLKVILYNPETEIAVVGIIAEYGPQPWTGMKGLSRVSSCNDPRWDKHEQRILWGPGFRRGDPNGFSGRIGGGGDDIQNAIKINNEQEVVMGFAKDQSIEVGTIIKSPAKLAAEGSAEFESPSQPETAEGPDPAVYAAPQGVTQTDCNYVYDKITWQGGLEADKIGFKSIDGIVTQKRRLVAYYSGSRKNLNEAREVGVKVRIDPRICTFIRTLVDNKVAPLEVSALISTHASSGSYSLHWTGHGIDFGNETVDDTVFKWVWEHKDQLQAQGIWPYEMLGRETTMKSVGGISRGHASNSFVAGHNNHFHISFAPVPATKK